MSTPRIAQITGWSVQEVEAAIRRIEPQWKQVFGFELNRFYDDIIGDGKGHYMTCYCLTKTELLYVAAIFDDATRAKLAFEWQRAENLRRSLSRRSCCPFNDCNSF